MSKVGTVHTEQPSITIHPNNHIVARNIPLVNASRQKRFIWKRKDIIVKPFCPPPLHEQYPNTNMTARSMTTDNN
jgi:hypothetical protein